MLSVTVGVVETEIALDPNTAPLLVAAKFTVLKYAFTVVPPVTLIPIKGLAALAAVARKSPILLLLRETVAPAETKIPFTVDEALLPDTSQIVFLKIFSVVAAPLAEIPITAEAPVEDNVLIVFKLMLTVVPVLLQLIPVTAPPVPEETNPVTVFELRFKTVGTVPDEPARIPIIEPVPVIFEMVLLDTLLVPVPKYAS